MLKRLFLGLILISSQVSSAYVDSVRVLELSPVRIDFNDSGLNKQALFCSAVIHGKVELAEVLIKAGVNPKNIYGMSKKINEEIADSYRSKNKIDFIGLRFFGGRLVVLVLSLT